MIDLIDVKRKIIYRFNTDIQSAVEYFCVAIIGFNYGKDGALFSFDTSQTHRVIENNGKRFEHFLTTFVKTKVSKKGYRYEMGSGIEMERVKNDKRKIIKKI